MHRTPGELLFLALSLPACGTGPADIDTHSGETGTTVADADTVGETSTTPTEATTVASGTTAPCILGADGCACVDGLCLGDLECNDGLCGAAAGGTGTGDPTDTGDVPPPACEAVIHGHISITNSLQLEQLIGVREISGNLSIGADLGAIPQLDCLEEVKSLTLSSGNDYSAMQALRRLERLTIWSGPGTVYPVFAAVQEADAMELLYMDEALSFPQLEQLDSLSLSSAPAPAFAPGFALGTLFMNEQQIDTTNLDGVVVQSLSVVGYAGSSLPVVTVEKSLDIFMAPDLVALSVVFPPTFPVQAPASPDDASNARLYIHGTGLTDLDELAGIATYTACPVFVGNPDLVDVSGLTGAAVTLAYEFPPDVAGCTGISDSPQLCLSHAQAVTATMTAPAPAQFYGLDDGC